MVDLPKEITPESLQHYYLKLIQEKYPNESKVRAILKDLKVNTYPLPIQIMIIQQYRDQLHETSPMLLDHEQRDKVMYDAIIPCLEDMENELQDYEEWLFDQEDNEETEEQ